MERFDVLVKAEKVLDDFNGQHGCIDNQSLCQWCHALGYDSISGILHLPGCIILELRVAIASPTDEVKPQTRENE